MSSLSGKSNFTLLYYRFKESPYYSFTLFFFVFLVGLLLLLFAVVPQFQGFFSVQEEVNAARERTTIIKNNKEFLAVLSVSSLRDDLEVTFSALPSEKDFVGILNALNESAAKSGVKIDDYSLAIGELATPSAGLEAFFPLSVKVDIHGDKESISTFLKNTQEVLPLSEIDGIETDMADATISYIFFFKVYKDEKFSIATPIAPLTSDDMKTLQKIQTFEGVRIEGEVTEPATDAASFSDPF